MSQDSPPHKRTRSTGSVGSMDHSPLGQAKRNRAIIESSLQLTAAITTAEATVQNLVSDSVEPGMAAMLEGLKATITLLTNALRGQQALLGSLLHSTSSDSECSSREVVLDIAATEIANERKSRCIVVSNLEEGKSTQAIERQLHDEEQIGELLNHLNVQCRPLAVYRVGKQSTGPNGRKLPRYTFVEFPSRTFALESLRAKHRLRRKTNGVDFSHVYLDPPMSKEERTKAYEARAARRKKTTEPAGRPTSPDAVGSKN
ncbi:hypothetical protein AAVH_22718 [Aphelenchoides avenae]|nr:hypothetical protein AAVH_22718 [Aphelenchus avenae]